MAGLPLLPNPSPRPVGRRAPVPPSPVADGPGIRWTAGKGTKTLHLIGAGVGLVVILGGCAASPEASRRPGASGADVGNRRDSVELLAPPDRFDRIYFETPYVGPRVAVPDTSQS